MRLPRRPLLLGLACGLLIGTVGLGLAHLYGEPEAPLDINVGLCGVLTTPQKLDIQGLRVPAGADPTTTVALLNAYRRDSRSREIDGDWVLRGRVNDAAADALRQRLAQAAAPQALRITSLGGSERAAIAMADLIAAHRLPVIVDTVCASACANYLLPAAPLVLLDGIVLMHGSPAACRERLGLWDGMRELGWRGYRLLRHAARRQHDFERRHPGFKALVQRSAPADRSDPSGAAHEWRHVPASELLAAHPGLTIGAGHARAESTYRLLLQAWPQFGDAYFPR